MLIKEAKQNQSIANSIADWTSFDFNSITILESFSEFGKFNIESI